MIGPRTNDLIDRSKYRKFIMEWNNVHLMINTDITQLQAVKKFTKQQLESLLELFRFQSILYHLQLTFGFTLREVVQIVILWCYFQ